MSAGISPSVPSVIVCSIFVSSASVAVSYCAGSYPSAFSSATSGVYFCCFSSVLFCMLPMWV